MTDDSQSLLHRILSVPVQIVVAIFLVLDGMIAPLFRPVMRLLSGLRLVQRLEEIIGRLPPYVILALLIVPFGFAELAKAYAVILMAEEHLRTGLTIFIGAYIVSILVCERTFHAGRAQLMTIGWFKWIFDWVMALKTRILDRFRRTAVWRAVDEVRQKTRLLLSRVQSAFGAKSKGTFEQR